MEIAGYIIEKTRKIDKGFGPWSLHDNKKIYKDYKTAIEAYNRFIPNMYYHLRIRTVYAKPDGELDFARKRDYIIMGLSDYLQEVEDMKPMRRFFHKIRYGAYIKALKRTMKILK